MHDILHGLCRLLFADMRITEGPDDRKLNHRPLWFPHIHNSLSPCAQCTVVSAVIVEADALWNVEALSLMPIEGLNPHDATRTDFPSEPSPLRGGLLCILPKKEAKMRSGPPLLELPKPWTVLRAS